MNEERQTHNNGGARAAAPLKATLGEVAGVSAPELADRVYGTGIRGMVERLQHHPLRKHPLVQAAETIATSLIGFAVSRTWLGRIVAALVRRPVGKKHA